MRASSDCALALAAAVLFAAVAPAAALGDLRFPGARPEWPERGGEVVLADAELFGIDGLRASGVRMTLPLWRSVAVVEVVHSGAAPASESRLGLLVAAGVVAVGVDLERTVAGAASTGAVSMSVMARLPLGRTSDVVFRAGGIGVRGRFDPGLDADAVFRLRPVRALALEAGVSIHRRYGESLHARAVVEVAPALGLRAGFDGATETAGATVCVSVRSFALEAGADLHAVLGVSRRVALRWRW